MKKKWMALVLLVGTSAAFGQAPAPKTPAKTTPQAAAASATTATKTSTPAAKKTTKKTTKTTQKSVMASPMTPKKPLTVKATRPKAVKKSKTETQPKAEQAGAAGPTSVPGKRRDPFISPVLARIEGLQSACQGGGSRCLAVNEIVLRGVVRTPSGMVAVVENAAQRTYFLHENTPIYNGFVEKITPDSVVFKEHYLDNLGHDSQREVVKTVNAPVV